MTDTLSSSSTTPSRIVVTGSSSGIGRAIALEFAHSGVRLVIHGARNRAGADRTAEDVRKLGADAQVVMADLAVTQSQIVSSSRPGMRSPESMFGSTTPGSTC
ncbi:MAG: SDR family NAD(P)-dependent oxidoreductase [Pirellulales bacterium]